MLLLGKFYFLFYFIFIYLFIFFFFNLTLSYQQKMYGIQKLKKKNVLVKLFQKFNFTPHRITKCNFISKCYCHSQPLKTDNFYHVASWFDKDFVILSGMVIFKLSLN